MNVDLAREWAGWMDVLRKARSEGEDAFARSYDDFVSSQATELLDLGRQVTSRYSGIPSDVGVEAVLTELPKLVDQVLAGHKHVDNLPALLALRSHSEVRNAVERERRHVTGTSTLFRRQVFVNAQRAAFSQQFGREPSEPELVEFCRRQQGADDPAKAEALSRSGMLVTERNVRDSVTVSALVPDQAEMAREDALRADETVPVDERLASTQTVARVLEAAKLRGEPFATVARAVWSGFLADPDGVDPVTSVAQVCRLSGLSRATVVPVMQWCGQGALRSASEWDAVLAKASEADRGAVMRSVMSCDQDRRMVTHVAALRSMPLPLAAATLDLVAAYARDRGLYPPLPWHQATSSPELDYALWRLESDFWAARPVRFAMGVDVRLLGDGALLSARVVSRSGDLDREHRFDGVVALRPSYRGAQTSPQQFGSFLRPFAGQCSVVGFSPAPMAKLRPFLARSQSDSAGLPMVDAWGMARRFSFEEVASKRELCQAAGLSGQALDAAGSRVDVDAALVALATVRLVSRQMGLSFSAMIHQPSLAAGLSGSD